VVPFVVSGAQPIADCDSRLAKYRAVLEAGADPLIVAGWMREVDAERLAAEQDLGETVPSQPLSDGEIRALIGGVRDGLLKLAGASAEQTAIIYQHMGLRSPTNLRATWSRSSPDPSRVPQSGVGGGTSPVNNWRVEPWRQP
jgi:hypothetical protein